jgi:hypothetical protein
MQPWQLTFLGRRELPNELTTFELRKSVEIAPWQADSRIEQQFADIKRIDLLLKTNALISNTILSGTYRTFCTP